MNAHAPKPVRAPLQSDLFGAKPALPEGFRYQEALLSEQEAAELVQVLQTLPFEPFDFQGHVANREVVGFGFRYDYASRQVKTAAPIPEFLLSLRRKIGDFAGYPPQAFEQVLINRYRPGAGIGWHRDKPHFEHVVGVSLGAPCVFRFRRADGAGWKRKSTTIEPRIGLSDDRFIEA